MWIIPSSLDSLCAQESPDSRSESEPPSPPSGAWATASGKPMLRPCSWIGWKNRPWSQHLFGRATSMSLQSERLTPLREWIWSYLASRVPRSPSPANEEASKTTDGSGPPSSASFAKFNPDGSFSKTSLDLFPTEEPSGPSSVDWPRWGSMRSGVCSAQRPWVPPTGVSGSSSWRGSPWDRNSYPTPTASPYGTGQNEGEVPHDRPTKGTPSLETGMRSWPTPSARDHKDTTPLTPRSTKTRGAFAERKDQLPRVAQGWPTPRAEDSESARARRSRGVEDTLTATSRSFPPALTTSRCGPECSPKHRRLNPRFVEFLQGLPPCWSIARTGSGPSAMQWSRWRRRLRSEFLRIVGGG